MQTARRLLAREVDPGTRGHPEIVGAALHQTCARVSEALSDSMGEEGRNALLARAFARAEAAHPTLREIRPLNGSGIPLEVVVSSVKTRGATEVISAVEALLAALVEVLGRVVGDDMAVRLIDRDGPSRANGGAQLS
jgi:hypothetical protein